MARRMEIADDFSRNAVAQAPVLSSTSGEGEGEGEIGMYNFTARRKTWRRKTITLNDSQRPTIGSQSLSESAFNTPSPSPFNASLPPSQLKVQTTFNPVDYSTILSTAPGTSSPKRTSGRSTVTSSPTRRQAAAVMGMLGAETGIIPGDQIKEMERGRGRGIPRTLTLPAHLTESLMMMKITRERDGSTGLTSSYTEIEGRRSRGGTDKDGMEVDGMEVDSTEPRKPVLTVLVDQRGTGVNNPEYDHGSSSPRKSKRRRARSLPPRPTKTSDDDECDADDEGGGLKQEDDENDVGLFSPVTPRRRGRREGAGSIGGEVPMQSIPMQSIHGGMVPVSSSGVLRRSARRVKPAGTGVVNPFMQRIAEAEAGSGMEGIDVIKSAPRKRARTREGGERDRERSKDEEGRAAKRTRKR